MDNSQRKIETEIIIIGSGAGGATVAYELAKRGKKVFILEKGPLAARIGTERAAINFYDKFGQSKTKEGNIIYRAIMVGGSTVVSCGNGVRSMEKELKFFGIDIAKEIEETAQELKVRPFDMSLMGDGTKRIFETAGDLNLKFSPMPKFVDYAKCVSCGNCILGCVPRAKWTALDHIEKAQNFGAQMMTNFNLKKIVVRDNKAVAVTGSVGGAPVEIYGSKIIVAAGAVATPTILQSLGISAGNKLFCDLFTVVYGIADVGLSREPAMSIVNDEFHADKGFIMSPFLDSPLSLLMTSAKHYGLAIKRDKVLGIMIKIKDDAEGKIYADGKISKKITNNDRIKLETGGELAKKILLKAKADPKTISITNPRGAHPGGSAAIGEVVDANLETKIKNLYVCDASVLPEAPGLPPIMAIVALSKRLAINICS